MNNIGASVLAAQKSGGIGLWTRYALCAVFVFVSVASNGLWARYLYFAPESAGSAGAQFERTTGVGRQLVIVQDIVPGSPFASLGIHRGDQLRLDHPWDDLRKPMAGEAFGFTRLTPGPATHLQVRLPVAPLPASQQGFAVDLWVCGNLVQLFAGLIVLWRGRRDLGLLALGMALVVNSTSSANKWPMAPFDYPVWHALTWTGFTAAPWLFLFFAMRFFADHTRNLAAWERVTFAALLALQFGLYAVELFGTQLNYSVPGRGIWSGLNYGLQVFGESLAFVYLWRGWRLSAADTKKRYVLLAIALAITFYPVIIYVVASILSLSQMNPQSPAIFAANVGLFIGPLIFAYAVLRHKVLDLGFVINRTLVYGAVSAILLVAFGLIEWAVDHLVTIEGREKNAYVDAAIALGVFLTFHRVRDFVEALIERVFFRSWHEKEAALRRFVKEASFITQPDALARALVGQLTKFAEGAPAALYARGDGGRYGRIEGVVAGAPDLIDADDPALVSLRAALRPLELEKSTLGAALGLPIVNRNEVTGVVLLAAKPSGSAYRPDEIEALGSAVTAIGFDLHALKVEALETRLTSLQTRNEELLKALKGGVPATV